MRIANPHVPELAATRSGERRLHDMQTVYTIKNIKTADETRTSLAAAIKRAKALLAEYQPAYGIQVEDASGETVWDSEDHEAIDAVEVRS